MKEEGRFASPESGGFHRGMSRELLILAVSERDGTLFSWHEKITGREKKRFPHLSIPPKDVDPASNAQKMKNGGRKKSCF